LKPEREMAVRALLNGRDILTALPTGCGPKKKTFLICHGSEKISKSIAPFWA